MYKVSKDSQNIGKFKVSYFLPTDLVNPLYHIENSTWGNTVNFLSGVLKDNTDSMWMHDLIRILDKKIMLNDLGDWSII